MPDVTPQATPGQAATEELAAAMHAAFRKQAIVGPEWAELARVAGQPSLHDPKVWATHAALRNAWLAAAEIAVAENASLREQLLRTEEQCRRHVNQADGECVRYKAERDEARAEAKQDRITLGSMVTERDAAKETLALTVAQGIDLLRERDAAREHARSLAEDLDDAAEHIAGWRREAERLKRTLERIRDDEHPHGSYSRDIARAALGEAAP